MATTFRRAWATLQSALTTMFRRFSFHMTRRSLPPVAGPAVAASSAHSRSAFGMTTEVLCSLASGGTGLLAKSKGSTNVRRKSERKERSARGGPEDEVGEEAEVEEWAVGDCTGVRRGSRGGASGAFSDATSMSSSTSDACLATATADI